MIFTEWNVLKNNWASAFLLIFCCAAAVFGTVQQDFKYLIIALSPLLLIISFKYPFIFPFGAYAFLVPFDSLLIISGASTGTTYTRILSLCSVSIFTALFFIKRQKQKLTYSILASITFILFAVASTLWAMNFQVAADRVLVVLSLFLLYLTASLMPLTPRDNSRINYAIVLGGVVAVLYQIYSYFVLGISYEQAGRVTLMTAATETDPNQFAFCLLIPLSVSMTSILSSTHTISRLSSIAASGVMIYGVLLSGSRGGLLGVISIMIVLATARFNVKRMIVVTIFLGVSLLAAQLMLADRLSLSSDSSGAGRLDIWAVAGEAFVHNPLFGYGLSNFPNAYDEYRYINPTQGMSRGAHNVFLGTVVELGAIGLFLLLSLLFLHYRLLQKLMDDTALALKAALVATVVSALFLDVLWRKSFWLTFILINLYVNSRQSCSIQPSKQS